MTIIEFAEQRLAEEIQQNDLGADNMDDIRYWVAYLDGAKAQQKEDERNATEVVRCKDCKHCYAEGFVNVRNVCEKHYEFGNVDDDWFCADGERKE